MTDVKKEAVLDDLAAIVDGDPDALARHADALADSDELRDLKHEAQELALLVRGAGADYVPPADLESRLTGALAARSFGEKSGDKAGPSKPASKSDESAPRPATKRESSARSSRAIWGVGLAAAAALGLAVYSQQGSQTAGTTGEHDAVLVAAGTGARIGQIVRAAADGSSGVEVRAPGATAFTPATAGTVVATGSSIRTDNRTRLRLDLDEGTTLVLNHGTEIALEPNRTTRLTTGELVADVAHLEAGPNATYATPRGNVEVLGTKFVLAATDELTSVRVTRGQVRVRNEAGATADVKAGEEGVVRRTGAPRVTPVVDLAESVEWSELAQTPTDGDAPISGIGELRARRPGEREDRERPLQIASHKVTVRIVGNMARTEIEEVFRNDSDQELEGIYRFPLPPDARIARLALDVEGRMEDGAFVEKDRAQRIWRGVIRNATAPRQRIANEEFIWVPGPWRDPALLEWQRGGRFELRIFPIPAHGERRVILGYTETLRPHGEGRRYVYPLPHGTDALGAGRSIGRFEIDARVAGAEDMSVRGYDLAARDEEGARRLQFSQEGFVPAGDLVLDFGNAEDASELRAWTYQGQAATPAPTETREGDELVLAQQRQIAGDTRPFVAFTIRPELPQVAETKPHDYVLVVDASQSMVGERWTRAARLAAGMVAEMDRRDRFVVLACDATCQSFKTSPEAPTSATAQELAEWFGAVTPAGASDLVAALREAATTLPRDAQREVHIVYVGDGMASVGERRVSAISAEVGALVREGLSFSTVGIGGDADTRSLSAIARSGGGHYVPYVPGERVGAVALSVLETTYGVTLRDAEITMPAGIVDVVPSRLPSIRSGEEIVVMGRMTGAEVRGEVQLRGKVGGQDYSDRYPVTLTASNAAGNLFVPQLWAAAEIDELELGGRSEDEPKIIALSKGFRVMSTHTSLLVLESEAMFRAFGVDRAQQGQAQWTGEEDTDEVAANGLEAQSALSVLGGLADAESASDGDVATLGLRGQGVGGGGSGAGFGRGAAGNAGPAPARRMAPPASAPMGAAPAVDAPSEERARREDNNDRASAEAMPNDVLRQPMATTPARPMPGRWMRRIWVRVGEVGDGNSVPTEDVRAVGIAEEALRVQPDSRDRHRNLVRALSRAGQLPRAKQVAEQWLGRDRLDAEALTYLADVMGRMGERDASLRMLSGVVDLRPDDRALQERLAKAFERAGRMDRACAHRVAISEIASDDADAVGGALRCLRAQGRVQSATRVLDATNADQNTIGRGGAPRSLRADAEAVALRTPDLESTARGDITVDAQWTGNQDLDFALITPQGSRLSWMGGRPTVFASDASSPAHERLGLRRGGTGTYLIEVSRAGTASRNGQDTVANAAAPISGTVTVDVLGERRTLRFTLTGQTQTLGRATIRRESRTVAGGGW